MKLYYWTFALLLISACTITPQDNKFDAEFHPPLTYQNWKIEHYHLKDGTKACSISSGYNGFKVAVIDQTSGEAVFVKSNRAMGPGATFTANTGRGTFQSYNTIFNIETGRALVADLTKGGKAYLEWSEFSGPSTRERINVQNIVKLDDFGVQLKQCRDSFQ